MPRREAHMKPNEDPNENPESSEVQPSRSEGQAPSVPERQSEAKPQAPAKPERKSPPNHVFVGKKPIMSYAMSALIQLAHSGEVVIKARGMVISRAVDVAEILTKRLGNNMYAVKDIRTDTELVGVGEGARNVSTIEITIGRK